MEAQASGLPIVATRIGGIPEEVGAGNLLVEQRDVEGIRHALKKLVKDQSLRKELGAANRARAEKLFSLKSQAQKTERAILSIL
jgi:glycosyltransferase involved in cell wall biosynthesis